MSTVTLHPALTQLGCPHCGRTLMLNGITPAPRRRAVMNFACQCGADYRMLPSLSDDAQPQCPQTGNLHNISRLPRADAGRTETSRAAFTPNSEQRG